MARVTSGDIWSGKSTLDPNAYNNAVIAPAQIASIRFSIVTFVYLNFFTPREVCKDQTLKLLDKDIPKAFETS